MVEFRIFWLRKNHLFARYSGHQTHQPNALKIKNCSKKITHSIESGSALSGARISAGKKIIMIFSQHSKYFSSRLLFALFLALHLSACSGEDVAKTIAEDASKETNTPTEGAPENTLGTLETVDTLETPGTLETTQTEEIPVSIISADINLSWAAPSEREDNQPISLSEIAGYKVYYGTSERNYTNSIDINDGSADGYTFANFPAGTYYFALTTYDTEGRESQYSTEIVIVV